MNELPWWLTPHGDGVPVEVLRELWANPALREYLLGALAPEGDDPFLLHVGGRELFDDVNRRLRERDRVRWDEANGAVTILTRADPLHTAAIAVDFDRILNAARGDSARARELTRDALLHELGHVVPVARARSFDARLGDPRPGAPAERHPVLRQENELRGLLGLPRKRFYGLLSN